MNYSMIVYIIGWILAVEAALMVPSGVVAIIYGETVGWVFAATITLCLALGLRRGASLLHPFLAQFYPLDRRHGRFSLSPLPASPHRKRIFHELNESGKPRPRCQQAGAKGSGNGKDALWALYFLNAPAARAPSFGTDAPF